MRIYEKIGQKLLDEFSKGTIEIKVLDDGYVYGADIMIDHEGNRQASGGTLYNTFELVFNKAFKAYEFDNSIYNEEYYDSIDRDRIKFYDELNEQIVSSKDISETIMILDDYKLRFEEVLGFYGEIGNSGSTTIQKSIIHDRYQRIKDRKGIINNDHEMKISSSFFNVQIKTIRNIIAFLNSKISFVRESSTVEVDQAKKSNKVLPPIEDLDRYQTALFFQYLADAGAIKEITSYNKIAPLISDLTGHSTKTLRTESFPQIQQIKMGDAGNKLELIKNKAYNLERVREVIRKIIHSVETDLKNNKESRKL